MYLHEELLDKGLKEGLFIKEIRLKSNSKALCKGRKIAINTNILNTSIQKRCFLSEEMWHNKVTVGNITDIRDIRNLKQERFARKCSFNELVPIYKIASAISNYCISLEEIYDYLGVTSEYFHEAIKYYIQKYGSHYTCKDYTLFFEPLGIIGSYCDNR